MILISTDSKDISFSTKEEFYQYLSQGWPCEMWISIDDKYPCLIICSTKEYASVQYYEDEDGAMYLSYKEDSEEEVAFLAGGEEWIPDCKAVISRDEAFRCIEEFLLMRRQPKCIEWQEL